ncbi:MAG: hypothetical protein KDA37_05650 [Planctomycetales bacterium]|nr:hypothetical protein [Planctomycetales bacterium]
MNNRFSRCKRCVWLVLPLVVAAPGCGGRGPESELAALNQTNIQRVTNLYFAYQKKNRFQGPPNEAAFKEFVNGLDAQKLERIGVDPAGVENTFVSERDGKPFRIRYGVQGSAMGSQEPVVFEDAGVGDSRQVGFLNLTQRDVDPAEYEQLWSGKVQLDSVVRQDLDR